MSATKRPSREHEKRVEPPKGAIPLEEYCEREGISLRKALPYIPGQARKRFGAGGAKQKAAIAAFHFGMRYRLSEYHCLN